ncbi:hypothetical protein BD289DRAFT_501492 [Coniella lustricola]|uniref:Carboxymuconolactone decarboxylase-like domain-containing protein n=1 Tax=Coniella lustricola TaxID=2025994 RepID=A0A2T3A4X1_9PEZI|nr:hypothetical protein BD289DRAFT_501492 [Coniella lustricola]
MQKLATQANWALIWSRPGFDRRIRSMLNLATFVTLGESQQLGVHAKGAVHNGVSEAGVQGGDCASECIF